MTHIIKQNFSQIKTILNSQKDEVIDAITKEKHKEIAELKKIINDKDIQINKLILKEGESKGIDLTIASLSINIDT